MVSSLRFVIVFVKVLKTLASPPVAKPFAISQQYKANMAESDNAEEAEPESSLEPPSKKQKVSETGPTTEKVADKLSRKPKKKQSKKAKNKAARAKPVSGACDTSTGYTPQDYSAKRCEFIQNLRDEGMSYGEAKEQWNSSATKKALLSTLSVSDLVRRRFCPPGTETNPWAYFRFWCRDVWNIHMSSP